MADIRNDQYLHRPTAGRGAITAQDPLEVLLYDGSGNPLLVKTPTGETRQALGVAGYGYDGTNWRPVKVDAAGQAEVTISGRIEVLAELEHVHVPANSIVDIVPRDRRIGYTELRGGFYVNGAVRGNYELRIRNLQPPGNALHPYSFRTIVALENDYWGSGRSLGIESVRWGVEFRNLNDFDITLRSVVVMGVRG